MVFYICRYERENSVILSVVLIKQVRLLFYGCVIWMAVCHYLVISSPVQVVLDFFFKDSEEEWNCVLMSCVC